MPGQRGRHRLAVALPQLRAALDVGEQEGDRAGRQTCRERFRRFGLLGWRFAAGGRPECQQARDPRRFALQVQGRHEAGCQHRRVGRALALLQATHLCFAVADGDGQFALGQAGLLAEKTQELAEGDELVGPNGRGAWSRHVGFPKGRLHGAV